MNKMMIAALPAVLVCLGVADCGTTGGKELHADRYTLETVVVDLPEGSDVLS